jgi:hypothetical protein
MEPQPTTQYPLDQVTPLTAVWETLTDVQQAAVLQSFVQVCQQLVADWNREVTDDIACPA